MPNRDTDSAYSKHADIMSESNKALQDLFDTVHYSAELIDEEEDELDPDDDEDYEPELSPEQELGMMSDEEFDDFIGEYFASKRRGEASTDPLVEAIRDLVKKHLGKQP